MGKKLYWVSRHEPLATQREALKRLGFDEVVMDPQPFSSAEEIRTRFEESGCDDILVVAPLSVVQRLTELGIHPLWAEMEVVPEGMGEVKVNGRAYRFVRFRRIKAVEIIYEEVE